MKEIKVDRKNYILLSKRELDALLDDARATAFVDESPLKPLQNDDLSPTECRFISRLRENVTTYEKIIVNQVRMDGMGLSVFRFHLRDIGGKRKF
jgi:hypothetical protein